MLPHLVNSQAGRNKWTPEFKCCYEVAFDLPAIISAKYGDDRTLLTEHVLSVSGLDALDKSPEADAQKFMGTSRSYLKPTVGDTYADITVKFSLNLRNGTDNYIYKMLRDWARLGYNIATGERHLKADYCADWMKVREGNPAGDVFREVLFKDVMLTKISGLSELSYEDDSVLELEATFRTDWWDDITA